MKINDFELYIGQRIFAKRPIYNDSDEIIPVEKRIRPFIILGILGNKLLVVNVTSNGKNRHNIEVSPWSHARTNDLYLITVNDVFQVKEIIDDGIFNEMIFKIYSCILNNDILYDDNIKKIFLEMYEEKIKKQNTKAFNFNCQPLKEGDIIHLLDRNEKKYIIDKITEDGYLVYKVNYHNNEHEVDFNHQLMTDKNEIYVIEDSIQLQEYNEKKAKFISKKYSKMYFENKGSHNKIIFYCGNIIRYKGKEYFVIYVNKEGKLVCIPYNGNYMLDQIITINTKDCVKYDLVLNKEDIVWILKKISSNIKIYRNNYLQNQIAVKIKEYS